MSESLTVRSMADALTEDKHKNGSKGKIYKALSDEHKNEEISLSISCLLYTSDAADEL